jgi:hypothetical protein
MMANHLFPDWIANQGEALKDATTLDEYDAAHDAFFEEAMTGFFGEQDSPVAFKETWANLLAGDRRAFAQKAAANMQNQVDGMSYSQGSMVGYNAVIQGIAPGDVAASLEALIQSRYTIEGSLTPEERKRLGLTFVKGFLDGLANAATSPENRGVASNLAKDVLAVLPWGPGGKALPTFEVGQLVKEAESRIRVNESEAYEKQSRDNLQEIAAAQSEITQLLIDNAPRSEIRAKLAELDRMASTMHPDAARDAEAYLATWGTLQRNIDMIDEVEDNESSIGGWYANVFQRSFTQSHTELMNLRAWGLIKNDTFEGLYRFLESLRGPDGSRTRSFFAGASFRRAEQTISQVLQTQLDFVSKTMGVDKASFDQRLIEQRALTSLYNYGFQYLNRHPEGIDEQQALEDLVARAEGLVKQAIEQSWPDGIGIAPMRELMRGGKFAAPADPAEGEFLRPGGVPLWGEPELTGGIPSPAFGTIGQQSPEHESAYRLLSRLEAGEEVGPLDSDFSSLEVVLRTHNYTPLLLTDSDLLRQFLRQQAFFYPVPEGAN